MVNNSIEQRIRNIELVIYATHRGRLTPDMNCCCVVCQAVVKEGK